MDIEALIVEPTVTLLPEVGDYRQEMQATASDRSNDPGDAHLGDTNFTGSFTNFTGSFTNFTGSFTNFTGSFTNFTGSFTNFTGSFTTFTGR